MAFIISVLNLSVFILSFFANISIWNGNTIADVSCKYLTFLTPAFYVFWIWAAVYFWAFTFSFLQLLPQYSSKPEVQAIGPWFFFACLFQGLWGIAWCFEQLTLSTICMFSLLLSLARLNGSIHFAPWSFRFGFTLWFGWVTVLSAISIVVAGSYEFGLLMNTLVTSIIMIVTLGLLGAFWLITSRELGFPIAINWALYGIYFSHYSTNV